MKELEPLPLQKVPIWGTVNADPKMVEVTPAPEPIDLTDEELPQAVKIEEERADIRWLQKVHFSPTQVKAILASIATICGLVGFLAHLKGCL